MTPAQLTTLAADINAQPSLVAALANRDATIIANFYNAADAAWIVWRTKVTRAQAMSGMDWTRVDNLSAGKARIWDWMFVDVNAGINAADSTVRAGIDAVWVGTQADLAVRATVYAACQRSATKGEHLLSSGTGTAASPATMGFEGLVRDLDVQAAMGWGM